MRALFFLFLIQGTSAIPCPNGYSGGGDGSCYTVYSRTTRDSGYFFSASEGAYLTDVNNAFQNTAIRQRAGSVDFIWLGLTCLNNSITSCQWDTGASMTTSSYNNFDAGRPVVENGPCVLMSVKTGKWYSADCSNFYAYVVSKYTPNVEVLYCENNDLVAYFRGKCYYTLAVNTAEEATGYCGINGFIQTSIHSEGENSYVKGRAVRYSYTNALMSQLFLGIQSNGTWTDGSAIGYENYGYKNSALGSCTSMSVYGDLVPAGKWISSQCTASQGTLTVCKRDPIEPTSIPTMSPLQCSGTQFLSGNGTIYSPGYLLGSQPNHCEYLITEDEEYSAGIYLLDVRLDKNSTLQYFSGLFDKTPFLKSGALCPFIADFSRFTDTYINWGQLIQSPTNMLKIVYDTAGTQNSNNLWYGNYQPGDTLKDPTTTAPIETTEEYICDPDDYFYSGTVNSQNFPHPYPRATGNCSYLLSSYQNRTCFKFNIFNIRYSDYVYIYTGYPQYGMLMASLTGGDTPGEVYCTPMDKNNWITLVFSTFSDNQGNVKGWSGVFGGDPEALTGTT